MEHKKVYPPPPYSDESSPSAPPPDQVNRSPQSTPTPPNPYQYQQLSQPSPMMPPNPYQYQSVPPPVPQVNVINQTVIDSAGNGMICPKCHARVRLTVERHATCSTWLLSGLLCLLFCWPCVCLPCCCNWCYKTTQYCPNCKACLGSF